MLKIASDLGPEGSAGNVGDAAAAEATGVGTGIGGANEYDQGDAGYD